jgi:hypothetical protein
MTMRAAIGFEYGTILEDPNITVGGLIAPSPSTSQKRQGDYSLGFMSVTTADFGSWARLFIPHLSEFYLQFAFYMTGSPYNGKQLFAWRNGATILGGLRLNSNDGTIEVYSGNFATLLGAFPYTVEAWQVIELHVKIADTGGIIQARKDMGLLAVDFSGDTKPGTETDVDNFYWGDTTWAGSSTYSYIDDIILNDTAGTCNNSWPGGLRIIKRVSIEDGGTLQFTPTPGPTHYTAIDEIPPVGTDNLKAATSGLVDELTLADCPEDVYSIAAVQTMAFGLKASSNPPTRVALGLKIGGTDYYSADLDLAVSQAIAKNLMEVSPATGVAFTPAELNAATLLLKSAD